MPTSAPPTVYLHIGMFKSGTTYLQAVLWENKAALGAAGILVPGRERPDQGRAVRDVLDIDRWGQADPNKLGAWSRVLREVTRWTGGSVIFSAENLSIATRAQVRTIVASLEPSQVKVIVTARDLARVIPASWQTLTRNGHSWTWGEFVDAIADPQQQGESPARGFWQKQDLPAVLERWSAAVPVERIHVVTVPKAGSPPSLLWERFASAAGVADPAAYQIDVPRANESIGAASAELLRRLNPQLRDEVPWAVYQPVVTNYLSKKVLTARTGEPRIGFDYRTSGWVSERAQQMVESVKAAGYPVTGDLGDLIPTEASVVAGVSPDDVSDAELLDSAMATIVSLVHKAGEAPANPLRRLRNRRVRTAEPARQAQPAAADRVRRGLGRLVRSSGQLARSGKRRLSG